MTRVKLSEAILLGHGVKSVFNGSRQPENYLVLSLQTLPHQIENSTDTDITEE